MKIKIKNATVYTMNAAFDILKNACVTVDDGKIEGVYTQDAVNFKADKTYDFAGDILMPGFVNAHAHSAMTLMRSAADDMNLQDWLQKRIFPLEKGLNYDCVYYGSYLAFLEYLRGGITTFSDMYYFPDAVFEAVKKCGINCVSVSGATDFGGEDKETLETLESNYLKYNGKIANYSYMLGMHSEYTTTDRLVDGIVKLSYRYRAPLYTHAAETLTEVGECTERNGGLTPILYLHKMGFFDNGASLAHCVHVDKDDIAVLAQSNVSVVTNPASNLKLASGIAPLYAMTKRGVNIAIGTDGAASNNALNMFREMYLASTLCKCSMGDPAALPAEDVLNMATSCGAKALFLKNKGTIETGKDADLVRISIDAPHFHPVNHLSKHLVYSAQASDVRMTMVAGKVLYEDGVYHIGEQPEHIYRECEKRIEYLTKRLER